MHALQALCLALLFTAGGAATWAADKPKPEPVWQQHLRHLLEECVKNGGLKIAPARPGALAEWRVDPGKLRKVRVRFSRPVALDDTITFQGKVTSIENGHLVAEILAKNQRGEEVLKGATIEADVG